MVNLHLGDVDVEAQKAIMADIERRKAEGRRSRGCERQDQAKPWSAKREASTSGGILPELMAGKGKVGTAPGSSAKRAAASRTDSRSAGWAVGVIKAQAKTAAVAAPKTGGGPDGQQVFSVDDQCSAAFSPMDIRDFFSKRG